MWWNRDTTSRSDRRGRMEPLDSKNTGLPSPCPSFHHYLIFKVVDKPSRLKSPFLPALLLSGLTVKWGVFSPAGHRLVSSGLSSTSPSVLGEQGCTQDPHDPYLGVSAAIRERPTQSQCEHSHHRWTGLPKETLSLSLALEKPRVLLTCPLQLPWAAGGCAQHCLAHTKFLLSPGCFLHHWSPFSLSVHTSRQHLASWAPTGQPSPTRVSQSHGKILQVARHRQGVLMEGPSVWAKVCHQLS